MTIIEIKDSDSFFKNIKFLDFDLNYERGYKQYIDSDVFIIGHPSGKDSAISNGQIKSISNYAFKHNIQIEPWFFWFSYYFTIQ